jgi:hypothetical protein
MHTLTITETHLFLGWLAEADESLHRIFEPCLSIETYDGGATCAIHLIKEKGVYKEQDQKALVDRWLEYCAEYNKPINRQSLQDLANWNLEEIFNMFSGRLLRFTLADGSTFFGRFQTRNYSPSTVWPHFPGPARSLGLEKLPNFYQDLNEQSQIRESLNVYPGQIRHVVPVSNFKRSEHSNGQ